jgi:hypothetical protein
LGSKESKTGPCGKVDPPETIKKLQIERGPIMSKHRPPPLARERKNKATTLNELAETYLVPLGTNARKEGAVVVVGE